MFVPLHRSNTSPRRRCYQATVPGALPRPLSTIIMQQQQQTRETSPLLSVPGSSHESDAATLVEEKDETTSPNNSKTTGQKILELAVPAAGALLIDPLMTLADTAFVGRFSDNADQLAGMGSAAALLMFSFYLFNFLCTATTPLVSYILNE